MADKAIEGMGDESSGDDMSIGGIGKTRGKTVEKTGAKKPASASDAARFSELLGGPDSAESAAASVGPGLVAGVDALLAAQESGEEGRRGGKARLRAEAVLDRLDALRLALLQGNLPVPLLEEIAALARARREDADPQLSEIIKEIELRARVELAKLGR
jgi:hypothetical protein